MFNLNLANGINEPEEFIALIVLFLTGTVFVYFSLRFQITKQQQETIDVFRAELEAYKGRVDRMREDITFLQNTLKVKEEDYTTLKAKKNYLKQLLIEALQTQTNVKDLIEKSLSNHNQICNKENV